MSGPGDAVARAVPKRFTIDVFPNPDTDEGGWWSCVDDGRHYVGGDLHRTKAEAEAHAAALTRAAQEQDGGKGDE